DAPCGRILSQTQVTNGQVTGVRFQGVPSFVAGLNRRVEVPGWNKVTYDVAYGGAFYAYVDVTRHDFEFDLSPASYRELIHCGMDIKHAVAAADQEIVHPFEPDLSFLYGTIFTGAPVNSKNDSRNVCVFADGAVDRSPTGSGVSGRMAIHHARGETQPGESWRIESIIDTIFTGAVASVTEFGPYQAVIPEVAGTAHITGINTFIVNPDDPLRDGFILR
ncbi:MAG: proline racemase family protein, partial [Pirellulaceae bacterium]